MKGDPEELNKAVVKYTAQTVMELFGDEYPIIKRMFPEANDMDLVILFKTAKALNLNPILREIYALPTGKGTQIYVGKSGLTRKLNEAGGFDCSYIRGYDDVGKNLTPKNAHKLSGQGFYVDCMLTCRDKTVAARAYWDEYSPVDLKAGSSWQKNPISMIEKVAFCKAARHFLGISEPTGEEMGLDTEEGEGETLVVLPHAKAEAVTEETKMTKPIAIWSGRVVEADDDIGDKVASSQKFFDTFRHHKYFKAPIHFDRHIKKHFGVAEPKDMTWEQLDALHHYLYENIADPRWYADDGHSLEAVKAKFGAKGQMELYVEIESKYKDYMASDPDNAADKLEGILSSIGAVYPEELTPDDKGEVFGILDKEFVK